MLSWPYPALAPTSREAVNELVPAVIPLGDLSTVTPAASWPGTRDAMDQMGTIELDE